MNAASRADLDAVPIPVEDGYLLHVCVIGAPGGSRVAWMHDGGKRKEGFGPVYFAVRDAIAASRYVNARVGS